MGSNSNALMIAGFVMVVFSSYLMSKNQAEDVNFLGGSSIMILMCTGFLFASIGLAVGDNPTILKAIGILSCIIWLFAIAWVVMFYLSLS